MWTHIKSSKFVFIIGSAVDLSKRMNNYFNESYLNQHKSMYIKNALIHHGYITFSLTILEYINIFNLSFEEARLLILSREQHYQDSLKSECNIQKIAESPSDPVRRNKSKKK